MIKQRYIIIQQTGMIPIKNKPINTQEGLIKMLKEILMHYPPDTVIIVARLTEDDDLWVDDGWEYLQMDMVNQIRKFKRFKKEWQLRHHKQQPKQPAQGGEDGRSE